MGKLGSILLAGCLGCLGANWARGTVIAYDHFQVGTGYYTAGNLSSQAATGGTAGYSGAWLQNTSAVAVNTGGMTNPLLVSTVASSDGHIGPLGNANARSQNRNFAAYATTGSDYYFSTLLRSTASLASGKSLMGLAPTNINNTDVVPAGVQVGYTASGLTLFYKGASGSATQTLLADASYSKGMTYMASVHIAKTGTSTADITAKIYNDSGTLVANSTVAGVIAFSTDLAALDISVSSNFTLTSPSPVTFDEFRYGTTEGDVIIVPEPTFAGLAMVGLMGLVAKRPARRKS